MKARDLQVALMQGQEAAVMSEWLQSKPEL